MCTGLLPPAANPIAVKILIIIIIIIVQQGSNNKDKDPKFHRKSV